MFYLSVQNVIANPLLNKIKCSKIICNVGKNILNKNTFYTFEMGHCMKINMISLDSKLWPKLFLIGNARVIKCCPTLLLYRGKSGKCKDNTNVMMHVQMWPIPQN